MNLLCRFPERISSSTLMTNSADYNKLFMKGTAEQKEGRKLQLKMVKNFLKMPQLRK